MNKRVQVGSIKLPSILATSVLIVLALLTLGCSSSGNVPPPPPVPDFSLMIQPSNASMAQGASAPVVISVTGLNSFASQVTITITGTPAGVTATPSQFTLTAGGQQTVSIAASATATTGSVNLPVAAVSGTISHPGQIGLIVTLAQTGASTPTLIQHVSTATNFDPGQLGNPYFISLPNGSGAGNALLLGVSYPFAAGRTIAVSDDKSNKWALGATTPPNPIIGQLVSSLYYALNVTSGTQKITVTFDGKLFGFQAVVSEFYNVAVVSAADGGSGNSASSAPSVTSGSFTTASAGDLIYSYAFDTNNSGSITGLTAGSGFTLLSADIVRGSVAQYSIQQAAGSINPGASVAGGADSFNAVGLALKAATAGTPPAPGIRIVHVYHVFYDRLNATLQFPSTGNLLLCDSAFSPNQVNISAVSTIPGNTWTKAVPAQAAFAPQIWYATNATTSPGLRISPTVSPAGISLVFYDVTGAATSPVDAAAGIPFVFQQNTNNANLLGMPVITPSTAGELIIAVMANGFGPTTGMVGAGQTLDTITYGGEIDEDSMDNADGYAHFNNPAAAQVSFGWLMNSSQLPETSGAISIAFASAVPPAGAVLAHGVQNAGLQLSKGSNSTVSRKAKSVARSAARGSTSASPASP